MIGIITADIINSGKAKTPNQWLEPLKTYLGDSCGKSPEQWEIYRGDSFQAATSPSDLLGKAIQLTALAKASGTAGARMGLGIGEETWHASAISESTGQAFVFSGHAFEKLAAGKREIILQTPWESLNKEMEVLLPFLQIVTDSWSLISAETAFKVLAHPTFSQLELSDLLSISQPSVSARYHRARLDEVQMLIAYFRNRVQKLSLAQ